MVTYVHGKSAALIHGTLDLSPWIREAKAMAKLDTADTSHFGSQSKTYIIGQNDGTFTFGGMYDGNKIVPQGVTGINEYLSGVIVADEAGGNPIPVVLGPGGIVLGGTALTGLAKQTDYEISAVISDIVSLTGGIQLSGGYNGGEFLSTTTTVSAATNNYTGVDDGALSTKGAFFTVHVLSNANAGTCVPKIQHSVDNVTWVDLVTTFTSVPAGQLSAQSAVIATGTTINRWLRLVVTLGGAGAVSVVATAARN